MIEETEPPCAECGRDEICADHAGRSLCNDCWHSAREKEAPFAVRRRSDWFDPLGNAYLKVEAVQRAVELNERRAFGCDDHVAVRVACWYGDRIAHPGYMVGRRMALVGLASQMRWR